MLSTTTILNMLYSGNATMDIAFKKGEDVYTNVDVEFRGHGYDKNPDCKITHFGYNFWFRTPKGVNKQRYSTLGRAIAAVRNEVSKHGGSYMIGVVKDRDTGNILFSF